MLRERGENEREGETWGISTRCAANLAFNGFVFNELRKNVLFFNAALPNTKPYQ